MAQVDGAGERQERRARRQRRTIVGAVLAAGIASGLATGRQLALPQAGLAGAAAWPPALALGVLLAYWAAAIGGGWLLHRAQDEVERALHQRALAHVGLAYLLLYPSWYLLAKAGLAGPPDGPLLFLSLFAVQAATLVAGWWRNR